jgi:Spy/CpxP family protein refolding chaperone
MISLSAVRVLVAAAAVLMISAAGWGQNISFTTTSTIGGGDGASQIASSHVERYAAVLGLSEDQRAVVDDLFESYSREFTAARVERDEQLGDLRAEARESGDHSVFIEDMPRVTEAFKKESDRLRDRFFDDLRLLLTAEQDARWSDVERTRRRVETIGNGSLSGESVDLVRIVEDLDVPAAIAADLAPTMDGYEADLDRALARRNDLRGESSGDMRSGEMDLGRMEETMDDIREASAEVRDVNERYARRISGTLPTDLAERFDRAVRRASFPSVYRETYTSQALGAALEFDDLDADQRAQLERLLEEYEVGLERANERYARAIADNEVNQRTAVLTGPGGNPMTVMIGEESEELEDVRKERRALNREMLSRVRGLLSPEQRDRLPDREERRVPSGGAARMVFLEIEESHDEGEDEPEGQTRARNR